jgi:hypothetical protein
MKRYLTAAAITALFLSLFCSFPSMNEQVQAASTEQITVLNPMGTPPPIQLSAMAPRLDTIEGKTIYIVNDGYPGSNILCAEMEKGFSEQFLWDEMAEKADALIIPLGH